MIDELADALFERLGWIVLIAIIALIIWVYLYIVEYSDWFRNRKKNKKCPAIDELMDYFKFRINYLIENISTLELNQVLTELSMITRHYLSIIKQVKILPGDTVAEITKKINDKDSKSDLLLGLLGRFEIIKHRSISISEPQIKNYLEFMKKILEHKPAKLVEEELTEDNESTE